MNSARFRPGGMGSRYSKTMVPGRRMKPWAGQWTPELVATG